ncbi:phenylacetate--CoA ligase family protein [Streptomyces lunaelactis]|nr:phenylacetate--CoA ligase family protein [Streptomyces lunaelactis]NUK40535.1 phenylacetate--CoA ligase family protein [Streptomyces lunaelactis]NUK91252.1 phenylacetate--CoA ligase family protein [Streptomyces lunaelactis]NUL29451.1 phenylacetate--CoA ligase family protein [Streptomyces lunaelactis]
MSSAAVFEAVREEIAYAFDSTVFFRKHMEASGLRPEDIRNAEDFLRIPPTSKSHYRRNFPAGVLAKGYTLNSSHVMRFQSSGTSGDRLNSAILAYDLARRQASALSVNRRFDDLWRPGSRPKICRFAPPNCSDVECATGFSTMEDRTLPDGTLVLTVAHDLLATPEWQVVKALDEIELYQPDLLVVDSTHLAFLARWARRLGRKITSPRPLHIVSGYTLMTRVARRQIEDFMGADVPIGDMIGMSELGYLGFECHDGHRHINNRDFYLEFIRDGKPVEDGRTGELYVTTVDDGLVPRIRYATGDYFTPLGSSCSCGSDLPVVRIEGRATHMIQLRGGRIVTPGAVDALVADAPWIDLYKLEQDRTGACTFRYVANTEAQADDATALGLRLTKALAPNPVHVEAVDYIACERSGKFQPCVSHISAEGARCPI